MHCVYLSSLRWDCWMVISLLRDVVSQPAKFFVGGDKGGVYTEGVGRSTDIQLVVICMKSILNLLQMTMLSKKKLYNNN